MTAKLPPFALADLIRLAPSVPQLNMSSKPTVDVGNIWLMRWDDEAQLGVVSTASDTLPSVIPIVFDGVLSADERFVCEVPAIGRGALLPHLRRLVPAITFDTMVGLMPSTPRMDLGAEGIVAPEIETDAARAFAALAAWQPGEAQVDVPAMIRSTGATPAQLARDFGITPGDGLRLLRGTFVPTAAQAGLIASRLRLSAEAVLAGLLAIPVDLRNAISQRTFREPIEALAKQRASSDTAAWLTLAQGVLAPQYRQKQAAHSIDWTARAHHWLDSNQ